MTAGGGSSFGLAVSSVGGGFTVSGTIGSVFEGSGLSKILLISLAGAPISSDVVFVGSALAGSGVSARFSVVIIGALVSAVELVTSGFETAGNTKVLTGTSRRI